MLKTAQVRQLPVAFHKIEYRPDGLIAFSGVSTMTASARAEAAGLLVTVADCPTPLSPATWHRVARRRLAAAPILTREQALDAGMHGAEVLYQQLALGQLGGSRLRALSKARSWAPDSAIRLALWLERYPEAEPRDFLLAELYTFLDLAEGALAR